MLWDSFINVVRQPLQYVICVGHRPSLGKKRKDPFEHSPRCRTPSEYQTIFLFEPNQGWNYPSTVQFLPQTKFFQAQSPFVDCAT